MKYASGEYAHLGDQVLIELGQTPARVTGIIETAAQARSWNLDEPGLLLESAPFGLVFWPQASSDPAVFVGREAPTEAKP